MHNAEIIADPAEMEAAMWSLEDIQEVNGRKAPFLNHLLRIGATSEHCLSEAADSLERKDGPFIVAFGQLPFVVSAGGNTFHVRGWREGVSVELGFRTVGGAFNGLGEFRQLDSGAQADTCTSKSRIIGFTQVTGLIRLWNKRARLHTAYCNHLTRCGVRNEVIGRVEDWMDMPEARMPLPARRYAPLTAESFEGEVARRVRTEFLRAVQSFLRAYAVACLELLPTSDTVYGYFAMIAPGRLAGASQPEPIAAGLCSMDSKSPPAVVSIQKLEALIDKPLPYEDRVLRQLMAMNSLLHQGERELALVGCTTAIEWFLNEAFPALVRTNSAGKVFTASIRDCLDRGALDFLDDATKFALKDLAQMRNAFVHGAPPERKNVHRDETALDSSYVQSSLFLALDVYRKVNLHTGKGEGEPPPPSVEEDD